MWWWPTVYRQLDLKDHEGVAKVLMNEMKGLFKKNAFYTAVRPGASGGLKNMKAKFDYKEYGGAAPLGAQPVVKAHWLRRRPHLLRMPSNRRSGFTKRPDHI